MKHSIFIAILILPLISHAGDLVLELHAKDISGQTLMVDVCNSEAEFLSDKKMGAQFRSIKIKATSDITTVIIKDIPSGKYAISVFVDSNQDSKLNKNLLGIPTELYGFSRDARSLFGPPTFAESAFELSDDTTTQIIHLK
ncbi:MAG: DUF2141 domain-containing protein [Betaproteobacteria bacterium]